MRARVVHAVIAACLALFSTQVSAQTIEAIEAAGQIRDIVAAQPEDVIRISSGGSRAVGRPYDYLNQGDELRLSGADTSVVVEIKGRGRLLLTSESNPTFRVGLSSSSSIPELAAALIARVQNAVRPPSRAIARSTSSRGEDENSGSELEPRANFELTLASAQSVPSTASYVIPYWQGDVAQIDVFDTNGRRLITVRPFGKRYARIPVDQGNGNLRLVITSIDRETREILVSREDEPVLPEWLHGMPASNARDLLQALWLLHDAEANWRLAGFSELVLLSETDFAAQGFLASTLGSDAY